MSNLTRDEVKAMGFYELPHFTIGASLLYELGRNRHLSISSLGTPNEVVFMDEVDRDDDKEITNLIVIRNYDYDGPLTREILEMLLKVLTLKTGHKAVKEEKVLTHCSGVGSVPLMKGWYVREDGNPIAWRPTKEEAWELDSLPVGISPMSELLEVARIFRLSITPEDFIPLREQYYAEKL